MRRWNLFWGIVIIMAGLLLLMDQFNILKVSFWNLFWPLVVVLLGAWLLLAPVIFKPDIKEHPVSVPLEGAQEAKVRLTHAAGKLEVKALPTGSTDLLTGTSIGAVNVEVSRDGNKVKARVSADSAGYWGVNMQNYGLNWQLGLNQDVPIRLKVKSGASETIMDLADIRLTELDVETGASSTEVALPAKAGFTKATFKFGEASVKIRVPSGVAAHIQLNSELSGINVDIVRFPKLENWFESPDYATAVNKVEIRVESGLGSIEIL
jgi:hypothetical protein